MVRLSLPLSGFFVFEAINIDFITNDSIKNVHRPRLICRINNRKVRLLTKGSIGNPSFVVNGYNEQSKTDLGHFMYYDVGFVSKFGKGIK